MAITYIKTILNQNDMNSDIWQSMEQRSQITYNNEVIVINWHAGSRSVFVNTENASFFLTSPDIKSLTIKDVIYVLDHSDKELITTWVYNNKYVDILNSTVENVSLHQADLV
jgi:hypothetical protein